MAEQNKGASLREVNISDIIRKLKKGKRRFFISLPIAFLLSCLVILPVPRYYRCNVKLAPEINTPNMGNLGSLASSFGLNVGNMTTQDAIIPKMYPDMMSSTDFQVSLFDIPVTTKDGKVRTTYFDYLKNHQGHAWWQKAMGWLTHLIGSKKEGGDAPGGDSRVNPFLLTKDQGDIARSIGGKIRCTVDKKTNVIAIAVTDQDPLICATLADSARVRLQQFIIDYRTKKARIDLEHSAKLATEAKKQYLIAQEKYAAFCDANEDLVLESFKSKRDELENEMQLKYNNYQLQTTQLEMAKAKLQERTPAFTVIQNASVPTKPAGPKRMFFVAFWLAVTFFVSAIKVYRKQTRLEQAALAAEERSAEGGDADEDDTSEAPTTRHPSITHP